LHSALARPAPSALEHSTIRTLSRRLLPFLGVLLVINFLDRTNLGYVYPRMAGSIGLTPATYGLGVGLFFVGYLLCEAPSNVALYRFGARRWISRIMVSWGLVAMCMGLIQSTGQFYGVRLLLGAAEAGFYPGIIYYLSLWYPRRYRARVVALFYLGVPIAQVFGAPLSAALVTLGDSQGLTGWRLMFLSEGLPAVALGFAALRWLPDRPADARWLPSAQKAWLNSELAREQPTPTDPPPRGFWKPIWRAMSTPYVIPLALIYLGITAGSNTLNYFLPSVLQALLSPIDTHPRLFVISLLTALPYAVAALAMVLWARHSDRTGERRIHIGAAMLLAAAAAACAVLINNPICLVLGFVVMTASIYSALNVFWSVPADLLSGVSAAAAIGLINSIGNFSGFLGPYAMGQLYRTSGSYAQGFLLIACIVFLAGISALIVLRRRPQ
jgi:MFS transporter, ACS family, tartrate transporter